MIRRLMLFLIVTAIIITVAIVSVYYINPYGLKTDNIRPRVFGFDIYQIPSKSMQPLLFPGDYIRVSNQAYIEKSPERKDVVVFYQAEKSELKSNLQFIKRVIGLAGDRIELKNGKLFVNKKYFDEAYVSASNKKSRYSLQMNETLIPKGHVFVMGDNRDNSKDSRIFGVIPKSAIFAKATDILYGVNNRSGNEIK
jgi:signal peptidase I